jgi:hypothetical protein
MYPLPLEAFAYLEIWLVGQDGLVLLSIVTQVLICNFCVQVPLLFFSVMLMTVVSGSLGF